MDLDQALQQARSGRGCHCASIADVQALRDHALQQGAWIDIVEVFESGDQETPRLELSLYGDHGLYGQPALERSRHAHERLTEMLTVAARENESFVFLVWVDEA